MNNYNLEIRHFVPIRGFSEYSEKIRNYQTNNSSEETPLIARLQHDFLGIYNSILVGSLSAVVLAKGIEEVFGLLSLIK